MSLQPTIALQIPHPDKQDKYFLFRLKKQINDEPTVFTRPEKMVVISDIEGNFQTFCRLLYKSKVIDRYLRWIFGENHLIIIGDCFDRGDQVSECLWLIYSLEEKAKKEGGYVHFILGNHEIMNMNGDWRYVHPKYASKTSFSHKPPTALYDGNTELWRWLQTKNIMEKIGDALFVHGGISSELLHFNLSIEEMNKLARPFYTRATQIFTDPFLNTLYNSSNSPFWYRGYYQESATEDLIDETLNHFGVKTIVTGHTVTEHISIFFNGKVINVNTDHTSPTSEALLIRKNKYYGVNSLGEKKRLK
jgi:hypothetical protein